MGKDKAKGGRPQKTAKQTYQAPTSTTTGKLNQEDLKGLLNETYRKDPGANQNYKNLQIDKELSNGRVKVYHDPNSGKTVVAHRGSTNLQDWKENFNYAVGIKRKGKAYKKSAATQSAAEAKYGTGQLETIGHSKGAYHAQQLGQKGQYVQTVNKPVNWAERHKVIGSKQTDYKNSRDPVSMLRGMQKGNAAVVQKSNTYNPLTNHSIDSTVGVVKKGTQSTWQKIKHKLVN
jgi:hypothetical protein